MRSINTTAFVLKSVNYDDADKIFTLLSVDYGKLSARAKGIRKITSKRRGALDTLNKVRVKLVTGNNGYKTITEVSSINSYPHIKKDLQRTFSAYYCSGLLHRMVEEEHAVTDIFNAFSNLLSMLSSEKVPEKIAVSYFEIKLMKSLGYELNFQECVKCGRKFDMEWESYKFNKFPAGFTCDRCWSGDIPIYVDTAEILNKLSSDCFSFKITQKTLNDIDKILRVYMEEILGEKIKSMDINI